MSVEYSVYDAYPSLSSHNADVVNSGDLSVRLTGSKTIRVDETVQYLSVLTLRSEGYQYPHEPALFVRDEKSRFFVPENLESEKVAEEHPEIPSFVKIFTDFGLMKRISFGPNDIKLLAVYTNVEIVEKIDGSVLDYVMDKKGNESPIFSRQNNQGSKKQKPAPAQPKAKRGKKQKVLKAVRVASVPEVVSEPDYEPLDPKHKEAMAKWREELVAENMANKKPIKKR